MRGLAAIQGEGFYGSINFLISEIALLKSFSSDTDSAKFLYPLVLRTYDGNN